MGETHFDDLAVPLVSGGASTPVSGPHEIGKVVVTKDGIEVVGFSGMGTCRETAILGALWAIGELQREVMKTVQEPGGGNICVD